MKRRKYYTLDVFTKQRLAGNPLAIVLDCEGFTDADMQKIAAEFNLSETVFVTSFEPALQQAGIRIFTPAMELPFAGHPTVGTAVLMGRLMQLDQGEIILDEKAGKVHCHIESDSDGTGFAEFTAPKLPQIERPIAQPEAIAKALGLEIDDLVLDHFMPINLNAGVAFGYVEVKSREILSRCYIHSTHWEQASFGARNHSNVFVFTRDCIEKTSDFRARVFANDLGVGEDPATGSAAAAFAGVIERYYHPAANQKSFIIEQGHDMGRPSQIKLTLHFSKSSLIEIKIAGHAVLISEGELYL